MSRKQCPVMTTSAGAPVSDNQNALTAGERGPILLQDYQLIEKLAHQNRERIPERVVHAKGWGAYGTFTVNHDISRYTRARVLQPGAKCDVLVRFSTVAGELGAADAERDVRGFAVKFYTEEGNWDLVGNNTPVFFIRDPYKFPDFIRTQKRHPKTHLRSPVAMWDFWSQSPESLHQITILMSDRGCPTAPMYMNGYGSHTFSFINGDNERFWVKFHFKTRQGHRHYTNAESAEVIGRTRESYQEALFGAIDRGEFPKWDLKVQIMPEEDAEKTSYNPFDLTKVWPHGDYPLIDVGVMELNRNPENYFAEVEQAAFSPSNIVTGNRLLAGQGAAGAHLLVRGRPPLPARHPLRGAAGERAQVPGASLPQGRTHAVLRAPARQFRRLLRAQQLRRAGAGKELRGAAAQDLGRRLPLRPPGGQRRLHPGREPVPVVRQRPEAAPVPQHRRGHVRGPARGSSKSSSSTSTRPTRLTAAACAPPWGGPTPREGVARPGALAEMDPA